MSLMLPRLIDDLLGRVNRSALSICPGARKTIETFVQMARAAEKFDFGELILEKSTDSTRDIGGRPIWIQPQITLVEQEAWDEGLIPLPAPICWYEYTLGDEPSGLLIHKDGDEILVQRVDYNPKRGGGVYHGIWVKRAPETKDAELRLVTDGVAEYYRRGTGEFIASGMPESLEFLKLIREKNADVMNFGADHYLSVYLTLMLNSATTEIRREDVNAKLNKARVRSGKEPLPPHRIVTIVPNRFLNKRDAQGGTHSSPRLHWRRSHKRHFERQTANAKWLASELYKGTQGWWVTIVPRCLVGLAELGELSHEYQIKRPTTEKNDK